jgi:hypothetical protein
MHYNEEEDLELVEKLKLSDSHFFLEDSTESYMIYLLTLIGRSASR